MAFLSCEHQYHLDHILQEMLPLDQLLQTTVESPIMKIEMEGELPFISYCAADKPNADTALYICKTSSWARLRSLVQLMSVDGFSVFGIAHLSPFCNGDLSASVWRLHSYSSNGMVYEKQHRGCIWFRIPQKYNRPFQWLASNKLNLHSGRMVCKESHGEDPERNKLCDLTVVNLELETESDASLLSGKSRNTVWTDELLSKHVPNSHSACESGNSSSLCPLHPTCSACKGSHEQHNSTDMGTGEIEITNLDLCQLKCESENKGGDQTITYEGYEVSKVEATTTGSQTICHTLRTVAAKYSVIAKRRGYHQMASEPMLILQCPGCTAEFRGITNRMLRLVDHIQTHGTKLSERYMILIAKRYGPLIKLMKKRLHVFKGK